MGARVLFRGEGNGLRLPPVSLPPPASVLAAQQPIGPVSVAHAWRRRARALRKNDIVRIDFDAKRGAGPRHHRAKYLFLSRRR
jgi:hypothetical protein